MSDRKELLADLAIAEAATIPRLLRPLFRRRRELLTELGRAAGGMPRCWDMSLDGQRFLMVKLEDRKPAPLTEMVLVENWFEELRRLAPTGKNRASARRYRPAARPRLALVQARLRLEPPERGGEPP